MNSIRTEPCLPLRHRHEVPLLHERARPICLTILQEFRAHVTARTLESA